LSKDKKSNGRGKVTSYGPVDHEKAFRLWMEHRNFSEVARHDDMPSRQVIHQWSKDEYSCSCPWHGYDKLVEQIQQKILREKVDAKIDNSELSSVEDDLRRDIAKFSELIKHETFKLDFLKHWGKLVVDTIGQSFKQEKEDRADYKAGKIKKSQIRVSQFRPKNIKEAIALASFIFTQERAIQGLPLPEEIMDRVPGATQTTHNTFNLKIQNIQEDELLTLLSNSVKLTDRKAEEKRVNNILDFALKGNRG